MPRRERCACDEIVTQYLGETVRDVVVIHNPFQASEFFIKRLLGLPGERLVIVTGEPVRSTSARSALSCAFASVLDTVFIPQG